MQNKVSQSESWKWIDQVMMIFMIVSVIILSSNLFILDLSLPQSPFLWPILIMFGVVLIIIAHRTIELFSKRNLVPEKFKWNLTYLIMLIGVGFGISTFGYFQEAYFAANESMYSGFFGILTTVVNHEKALFEASIERIMKFHALEMISIYLTILIALFWYFLQSQLKRLQRQE
ncbi:hypothetical protein JW964_14530 [candidate division KSB1 bacterium]|nr:hypothetical protein [candidate division KSB1 bacterium]